MLRQEGASPQLPTAHDRKHKSDATCFYVRFAYDCALHRYDIAKFGLPLTPRNEGDVVKLIRPQQLYTARRFIRVCTTVARTASLPDLASETGH